MRFRGFKIYFNETFFRHAQELHVLPKLKEYVDRFQTVEDFKVLYTVSVSDPVQVKHNTVLQHEE